MNRLILAASLVALAGCGPTDAELAQARALEAPIIRNFGPERGARMSRIWEATPLPVRARIVTAMSRCRFEAIRLYPEQANSVFDQKAHSVTMACFDAFRARLNEQATNEE